MDLIRICTSDDFDVDYDKERGMYRVTVFENGHFWDEFWFDCYEERELALYNKAIIFPQTMGNMTFYSKEELIDWVEKQQKRNAEKLLSLVGQIPEKYNKKTEIVHEDCFKISGSGSEQSLEDFLKFAEELKKNFDETARC